MLTPKKRMLMAIRGNEMADIIPFAPRIDLWYNANSVAGTLPEKHQSRTVDEIARAEGWGLHKVIPDYRKIRKPEDTLHSALGVFSLIESVYSYKFSSSIEAEVASEGDRTRVTYHTPIGTVSATTIYTDTMKKAGVSSFWIEEPVIKKAQDYRIVGHLFENLELLPDHQDFMRWSAQIGEDGLAVSFGMRAASPMHHIQKHFLDSTTFYYHYRDFPREMRALSESLEGFFEQALNIVARSPAEAVLWGINFDDMITYPEYFRKDILPWIRKTSEVLSARGKFLVCHCDGENLGLMDLIRDSGMAVAEGICPFPMTKVRIEEYYQKWCDRLTIFGGIPSVLLLDESATEEEFEAFLDQLFKAVAPGNRLILGIGDTVPARAKFERLIRINERVQKEGRLPLQGGAVRPVSESQIAATVARISPKVDESERDSFRIVQEDVLRGDHLKIKEHIQALLHQGMEAQDILKRGMISAMEIIGDRFKAGTVFIPEVLLSARAMNEGLQVLEPYFGDEKKETGGKVLIATVEGDLHDIGKNMVVTMLKGVGFEIKDMGINVPTEKIVEQVSEYKPHILALSALLTTTMPEMRRVIEKLQEKGLRETVRVMVGGAPVNKKFASDIGADAYGRDAGEAVQLARALTEKSPDKSE